MLFVSCESRVCVCVLLEKFPEFQKQPEALPLLPHEKYKVNMAIPVDSLWARLIVGIWRDDSLILRIREKWARRGNIVDTRQFSKQPWLVVVRCEIIKELQTLQCGDSLPSIHLQPRPTPHQNTGCRPRRVGLHLRSAQSG